MPPAPPIQKIAMVSDWYAPRLGGVESHVADLAAALARRGLDVAVLTTTKDFPMTTAGGRDFTIDRLATTTAPGFGFSISPFLANQVTRRLEAGNFDVVHVHASVVSPLALAGLIAARRLDLPAVVTFHSMLLRAADILARAEKIWRWGESPLLFTAVSRVVAAQAGPAVGGAPVEVLSNGVDLDGWPERPRRPFVNGRKIVFATAMRLTRKKRPLELLDSFEIALKIASASDRELELRIAGEGPLRGKIEARIATGALAGNVRLLGRLDRDELRGLYASSDAFVMPSTRESFGIAALEARASGLPVVAMTGTGADDFLTNGETALLASDDRLLAAQMARLACDDALREKLGRRDTALKEFDWANVAERHIAAYAKAASLVRPRPPATAAERSM